jgi:hypothetical protein
MPAQPQSRAADGLGGKAGRAAGGCGVPAAQPGGGDHRCRQRGADHCGQRVQAPDQQRLPLDLGVPEPRALLAVPVDPLLHRVDVNERQHARAGQQRRLPHEPGQELPAGLLQLGDVAPGIRSAGAIRAWTGRGPRRTGHPSRRAAARPCHQSSPRPPPCPRPGTAPSGAH